MKHLVTAIVLSTSLLVPAYAQVTVKDAWVRATVPQQKVTGAFMQLTSAKDARVVEVKSSVAGMVEIHEMAMEKDVMKMRAVTGIDLPAGKAVELKPGGYHVMLMDLKQQMKEGDTVPLTLTIEGVDKKRSTVKVKLPVKALADTGKAGHSH